jgi:molecular chaperone DnaK
VSKAVGIDLGTTNSLVAFVEDGVPTVIPDPSGDVLLPSIVSVDAGGTVHVGREAERRLLVDPARTAYSTKRFMGKGFDDVRNETGLFPFRLSGESGGVVRVGLGERDYTPPEIGAFILRELKRRAETYFAGRGEFDPEVDRAVITVPAYFNDAQRTATRDAGRIAGLEVLRIINEPTAASLAYGLGHREGGVIAVYDFGGGTFDISILRVEDNVFQVLSTHGDTHLGGDDIDDLFAARMAGEMGVDLHRDPELAQAVRMAVIAAKWELSERQDAEVHVKALPGRPGLPFRRPVTRAEFEEICQPVIARTIEPCRQALKDAGLIAEEIEEAVLVGGSTRIPLVRRTVEELFRRKPHADLNPDQVVALGAAIQANILVTGNREMLLLDVTPLSLGIETVGGAMSKIIYRNSTIPASGSEMFTTFIDNQTAVDIHVLQGERELVADNRSLARFKLRGIPPMPAGLPRIQVRFQIDANGILSVGARELRTGIEQSIEVKPSYGLTDEEVERILLESFEHAEEDIQLRLVIEARNEAQTVIRATEKSMMDPGFSEIAAENLTPDEVARIEASLARLREIMPSNDREAILEGVKNLSETTRHLAEVQMNRSVRAALAGKNVEEV